jgi:hypothetical protein
MIYNKVVKKGSDIGKIEEKLIFKRNSNDHLIPLIDIKRNTLEIFYSNKTAAVLHNKTIKKENMINQTSGNYRRNIRMLYGFINNLTCCEYADMQFGEFVYSTIHRYFSNTINRILRWLDRKNRISPEGNDLEI